MALRTTGSLPLIFSACSATTSEALVAMNPLGTGMANSLIMSMETLKNKVIVKKIEDHYFVGFDRKECSCNPVNIGIIDANAMVIIA